MASLALAVLLTCLSGTLTTAQSPTPACRADVSKNGVVDQADLDAAKASMGKKRGDPLYNPAVDFDGNGIVNLLDLTFVSRLYGQRCEAATNRNPLITSQPVATALLSSFYQYQVVATDPDNDPLGYQLTAGPEGMAIDGAGLLKWTPGGSPADYQITVVVSDGKGGTATQSFQLSVLDGTPPFVTLSGPDKVPPGGHAVVTAAVTDNVGIASVVFEVNGVAAPALTVGPYQHVIDVPSGATAGTLYKVKATATDPSLNVGYAEISVVVDSRPDTTGPVVHLIAPAEAAPGTLILLTASAADDTGVAFVSFSKGGVLISTDSSPPFEATFLIPADTPVGSSLTFAAEASDFAGNKTQDSKATTIVAAPDTTAPTVDVSVPAIVARGQSLLIAATASDAGGIARVDFLVNGVQVGTSLEPPYQVTFPVPADTPVGALLRIEVRAVDSVGLATPAFAQTVVAAGAANRPPVANAGGPYSAEAGAPATLTGSATTDADGDQLSFAWDFGDGTTGSGANPVHTYTSPGSYVAILSVVDGRGGSDTAAATVVVILAPDREPPVIALAGPAQALPGTQALFTAEATDNRGIERVTFEVNASDPTEITAPPYQRTIPIPSVAAPGAVIKVRATARDAAGNTASADRILTIGSMPDTEPPVVVLNLPAQAAPGSSVRLTATARDNVGVASLRFLINGAEIGRMLVPPFEATFVIPSDATVGSTLTVVAQAQDFSGNLSEAQGIVSVVQERDTTPPTVTLTAPAEAMQGARITLSATAVDGVGVASVAFYVDDARIATLTAPPYQAEYRVPVNLPAGRRLHVEVRALDFADLPGTAFAQVLVTEAPAGGQAVVAGEVYDDTTGLPLDGATVALVGQDDQGAAYAESEITDSRGRYVIRAHSGHGIIRITKPGWTRVDRSVSIAIDRAVEVVDARLTALGSVMQRIDPVFGGSVAGSGAALAIPGGALQAASTLTLTPISQQGIQGLLPGGWSPVGGIDITPHGISFAGGAALSIPNATNLAAGTLLVLASWDEAAAAWIVIAFTAVPPGASELQGQVGATGQYLWLLADTQPAVPPQQTVGGALSGVTVQPIPETASAVVEPQPRILFYKPGVRSDVRGRISTGAQLSSGTMVLSRTIESYSFRSGDEIRLTPFAGDLFLYQVPGLPATVSAGFPVTPSLVFDPLDLDTGVITVELHAPGVGAPGFTTIGQNGGTVTIGTGQSVQFPAGATIPALPVGLEPLTLGATGLAVPPGLEFLDAVLVSFPGDLFAPAVLSIPRAPGVTDTDQILIVRAQEIGHATRLVLVGIGRVAGDRILSDTTIGGQPGALEGLIVGGRYLVLRATSPVGFVMGAVRGVDDAPFAGALVSSNSLRVVALSRSGGTYALAAGTGPVSLTALDLERSDTGIAPTTIPGVGAVAQLDLHLVAQVPQVVSVTPADGAENVLLSTPVIITFSKPIDPASVSGANAANVLLTAPDGSPIAGTISLSSANTIVTLRPAAPLASNTTYALTLSQGIVDVAGRPLGAVFTSRFSSLDTTPPPVPPAGSITAAIPGAGGTTTITATQGTAGPHDTVTVLNVTRKTTTPVLVDPNGGFLVIVPASVTDQLRLHIVDPAGNGIDVELPRFQQVNADGSLSASVNASGGRINGPGGVAVDVPAGAFPDGAVVTIKPIAPADFPIQLTDEQKTIFSVDGGVSLDFGRATPAKYLDVSIPPVGGETATDQWVVGQVVEVNGQQLLSVVDTARFIDGRITTSSPPCPGVTAAGVYGFVKSRQPVGVNYAQAYARGEMLADLKIFMLSVAIPWVQFSSTVSQFVCYPVLTANVTIVPNKAKITIAGEELAPVDRKIKVTNSTREGRIEYFPRDVSEYVIEVTGGPKDAYRVDAIGAKTGQLLENLGGISFGSSQGDKVTMRIDPSNITIPVAAFRVRNFSRGDTQETIPVALVPFELLATGSEKDTYLVEAIPDTQDATKREVVKTVLASAAGAGNLIVQAAVGSIDPNRAELDAAGVYGTPARTSVSLTSDKGTDLLIPDSRIVNGGFAVAFDGDEDATYTLTVYYDSRAPYSITIPKFEITISNPTTGRVIKVIRAHAPPRYEPQNLGTISDDETPPLLLSGPARVSNFDPAGSLTFSFSEPMDAASVKENLVITDSKGNRLKGTIQLSNQNMVVTFVPAGALRLAETYTVTFKGGQAQGQPAGAGSSSGMQDPAGNAMPATTLVLKTFTPRLVTTRTRDVPLKDIAIRRIPRERPAGSPGQPPSTIVYVTTGGDPGRLWAADLTDLSVDQWYAAGPALPTSQQRVVILPDAFFSTLDQPPQQILGALAVTSSFNTSSSNLSFLYLAGTNDPLPALIGGKTLTINPDLATYFNQRNRTFAIGYAKGVASLKTDTGVAAYAAVEHVGVMASSVEQNSPARDAASVILEGIYPGDFTDIASYKKTLLAVSRSDQSLTVLDPALTPIAQRWLNYAPRRIRVVEGLQSDLDGDGYITAEERFDLAVIGCDNAVVLMDIRNPADPKDIGIIRIPGIVRELDVDRDRRRVFAGVDRTSGEDLGPAFFMIDVSDPTQALLVDYDNDQIDDRIIWRKNHPAGFNSMKLDDQRGLLYVTGASGLEIWAVYDDCCDLGVDMDAQPAAHWTGDKDQSAYIKERTAIQKGIVKGLDYATANCPGFNVSKMKMLESGSSACLWTDNPAKECGSNYQPGVSDHDISVFLPDAWFLQPFVPNPFDKPGGDDREEATISLALCTLRSLSEVFTDGHTNQPRTVEGYSFADISFLPNWFDDFEKAMYRLDQTPPTGFGDQSNDMALGRQSLVMKHMTEAHGVVLEPYSNAYPNIGWKENEFEAALKKYREETKIPLLEGYEWNTLMQFTMAKAKAYVRIKGSSDERSAFHDLFVHQLHLAGKAGIRATLARMNANEVTRDLVLSFARTRPKPGQPEITPVREGIPIRYLWDINGAACLQYEEDPATRLPTDPSTWTAKTCGSMEEYVASTAIRTLLLPKENQVFTMDEVLAIQRFYRVKADEEQIRSDTEADKFIALVYQFIQKGLATTKAAYDAGMAELQVSDPTRWQERTKNLSDAQKKTFGSPEENSPKKRLGALGYAPIQVIPHVFNIGYRNFSELRLAMYVDPPSGPRPAVTEFTVDLMGGEHAYPAWKHKETGTLLLDENREAVPIFELVVDQTGAGGVAGEVALTIDLPQRKAREADRENNVGGFFYYVIDVASLPPVPPGTAAKVATPSDLVANYPDMLEADKECTAEPSLDVNQLVVIGNEALEPPVVLLKGEQATLRLVVTNSSATTAEQVVVCTTLTGMCYSVGTLMAGETATKDISYRAGYPTVVESTVTAYANGTGIQVSAPFDVVTGCQPWVLTTFDPDPNPYGDKSTIMAGGTSYRHYRVIKSEISVPWENAEVIVRVSGREQELKFTTDANGVIGTRSADGKTFEPGITIPFANDAPAEKTTVSIESIAGEKPICGKLPQYDVTVKPFEFQQALKAGVEISAEVPLAPAASIGFKNGGGFAFGFDATNPGSPSFSSLNVLRSSQTKVTGKLEASPFKYASEYGGASMGVWSAKTDISLGWTQFDTHQFGWNDGLSPQDQKALVGLAIATISGAEAVGPQPLVQGALNKLREVPVKWGLRKLGLGGFESRKVSQGWTLTVGSNADFTLLKMRFGGNPTEVSANVDIGGQAGVAFTVGYNNQLNASSKQVTLIEPSVAVTGFLKMMGTMSESAEEANKKIDAEDLPNGFKEKMKGALKTQLDKLENKFSNVDTEANIRFSMVLDPNDKDTPYAPTRLDMTVFARKPFGIVKGSGGQFEAISGRKGQYHRTYSLTTREDMVKALKAVLEYKGLLDPVYREKILGTQVGLKQSFNANAAAIGNTLMDVIRMLLRNGDYRDAVESGEGFLNKQFNLGGKLLQVGLSFDTTEAHTLEQGVFRGGQLFKLEDYNALSVPTIGWDDLWGKILVPAFTGADPAIQSNIPPTQTEPDPATGGGRLTTQGADLRVGNANDFQQIGGLAALDFTEVQGPVAPAPYMPSDVLAPAGKPHYGVGGFYDVQGDTALAQPAQLTLSYQGANTAGINENSLAMYRFNEQRRDWEPVGGTLDLVNKAVSAAISDLGTYTLGPAMPAGTLTWSIVSSSLGDPADPDSVSTIRLVSNTVLLNTGSPIPADTVFHVVSALPEGMAWEPIPFGQILTPDVLPDVDGIQVRVNANGQIELEIRLPGAASSVRLVAFSDIGTAMSDVVVAIR